MFLAQRIHNVPDVRKSFKTELQWLYHCPDMVALMYGYLDVCFSEDLYSLPGWAHFKKKKKLFLAGMRKLILHIFLPIIYFAFVLVGLGW